MKGKIKISFLAVLMAIVALAAPSCKKKEVKKISVNNQFAVSLFNDTIYIKDILNDMDSTTNSWLRVKSDGSLFVYYADSVKGVIKASDLLDEKIPDVNFATSTSFTMPEYDPTNYHDTVVEVDKFMTVPFNYEGYTIDEVVIRKGVFDFDFVVDPPIDHLKQLKVYCNQLISPDGEPLVIVIDYNKGAHTIDLANYRIKPENDTVAFGADVTIHVDSGVYPGGSYVCTTTGGITGLAFKTIAATVTKTIDSTFNDRLPIDFGINGLSGSALLPVPTINLTYKNTFGITASSDVDTLQFYNSKTGLTTNLLATDHWQESIEPTGDAYVSKPIGNFVDQIDALAGYTRLDFDGKVTLARPGEHISISDTSSIDVIADIEMPMSFKISDLHYIDTVDIKFGDDVNAQNYLDEVDIFIDYNNKIPLQVNMQGYFLKNGFIIDSLFNNGTILYNEPSSLECVITEDKLSNVMRANKMMLKLGVTTEFQTEPVVINEANGIVVRMRMLTKTNEINIEDL